MTRDQLVRRVLLERELARPEALEGMGRTAAELFAREGARVVIADYSAEAGEATTKAGNEPLDGKIRRFTGGLGFKPTHELGAFIYVIGKDIISTITPLWQIFLGALFIACVLGFPRGILGSIAALTRRTPPAPALAAEEQTHG